MKRIIFTIFSCLLLLSLGFIQFTPGSFAEDFEDDQLGIQKIFDCNCVAFRLDDVQDHFLNEPVKKLIEIFKEENLPYTLGIMSNDFGEDEELVDMIRDLVNNKNYKFEIASHGTIHEDFTKLSYKQQKINMKESIDNIEKTLGISPKVFIPPFAIFNEGTIIAMKESGITHFSPSIILGDNSTLPYEEKNFYQISSGAVTGEESSPEDNFIGVSADVTFSQINENIKNHGYSIVTMHPMEFGVIKQGEVVNEINVQQFEELEKLLYKLQRSEYPIVNIQDIAEFNLSKEIANSIPFWVRNIFIWYGEEKIDEQELKNALQFLIREKILIVD